MNKMTSLSAHNDDPSIGFEEIRHTADLALRIYGKDLSELMRNAALGMTALMREGPVPIDAGEPRRISVSAMDAESLLVEWLSELAILAESHGILFHTVTIDALSETAMEAIVYGCAGVALKRTIKAVTYHNLAITRTDKGLAATVVFDV